MRAVAIELSPRRLAEREIEEPRRLRDTQVLFQVREVGVCGTDRDLARFRTGMLPEGESYLVLGHEALGQVVEAGPVTGFSPGDWVVPTVRRACPGCPECARGRRDLCRSGQYTERGIIRCHGYFTELAIDEHVDLLRVPAELSDCAILIEPLSVVEKAIERAFETHPSQPERALVLGAGPVGILAAYVLRLRGLAVDVFSLESRDHPRVRLLEEAGIRYRERLDESPVDLIIEAAGSAEITFQSFRSLAPMGVLVLLGAKNAAGEMPFFQMIIHNQSVIGSVNSSPHAFELAIQDLARMERRWLTALIQREAFSSFADTILGEPRAAAKLVHVIGE
jgi:threonine dehydrogenase-like Zn-dependent dehydrogenase